MMISGTARTFLIQNNAFRAAPGVSAIGKLWMSGGGSTLVHYLKGV
jgi:hypothetical protein